MTTTQLKGVTPETAEIRMPELADWRTPDAEDPNADELRLLALEIIMHDPELAKQLMRAGVQKVMQESPTASG